MPRIKANGIELYYELHGPKGADVLVLSNGVLMSTGGWALQVPALARHYRVLLYDCRGMWQSDHPAGPYSMDLHADDLAALLDALRIDRAHIGGVSYGGEISLVFALKHPQRTRSLIVSSAVSQVDPVLRGMVEAWMAAALVGDPDLLFQVTYPVIFGEPWIAMNRMALDASRERYKTLDMAAFIELVRSFSGLNVTAELHRIAAPALVMVGEDDILKPRKYAEIIARELVDVELAVLPHAAHAVHLEQAELFNSLILGFLAKQG